MNTKTIIQALRKYWIAVSLISVLGVTTGAVASTFFTPSYLASTSVFITLRDPAAGIQSQDGVSYLLNQANSFAALVSTPLVLNEVVKEPGLTPTAEELASTVSARVITGTSIVEISARAPDPDGAARLATSVAEQLVKTIDSIAPSDASGSLLRGTMTGPAAVPAEPTNPPKLRQNLIAGALAGLLAGIAVAVLWHSLASGRRSESEPSAPPAEGL